jgi:hypothetical protein
VPFSPDSQVPGTFNQGASRDVGNHRFFSIDSPRYTMYNPANLQDTGVWRISLVNTP